MKTLIIGGCGYIGSALYLHLSAKENHEVDTVDLELRGNLLRHFNICKDYRNATASFLSNYTTIIHLAGHSSVLQCKCDPHGAIDNNLIGFIGLLSKLNGQRLIYASSSSIYSDADKNVYDFSKRACDEVAALLYDYSYGLRFGTVNGPSPNIRRDLVINAMTWSAKTTGILRVNNEHVNRPILGINDLCHAVDLILEDAIESGVHNIASFNTRIWDIADAVSQQTKCKVEHLPSSPTYDFKMKIDHRFEPKETLHSIVEGLLK